jgi:hypothetical protein
MTINVTNVLSQHSFLSSSSLFQLHTESNLKSCCGLPRVSLTLLYKSHQVLLSSSSALHSSSLRLISICDKGILRFVLPME